MDRLARIGGHITGRLDAKELRKAQIVAGFRRAFALPIEKIREMQTYLLEEMQQGLVDEENANIKMLLAYVGRKATEQVGGFYYALDLGGTNFRVLKLTIAKGKVTDSSFKKFKIPLEHMQGEVVGLFDFIADAVAQVAGTSDTSKLGFTFSFPMSQTKLNAGRLVKWTKGFTTKGVVGEDIVQLLQAAFDRKGIKLDIVALCNDTVGTLVCEYFKDAHASMGVILGTGSNAAYWEKKKNIPKYTGPGADTEEEMAINMEWGNFDSGSTVRRALPQTRYDVEVDAVSPHPGQQLYEKMISGLYVSKICKRVFVHFAQEGILPALGEDPKFTGWDVSSAIRDTSVGFKNIVDMCQKLWGVTLTVQQAGLVQDVCARVALRAARLAAMGIATTIQKMDRPNGVTIAIDGSLYEKTPYFPGNLKDALYEILGAETAANVKLTLTQDGSGIGAGLIAGLA